MIKTEKELLRLIWKEMGLGGHNSDIEEKDRDRERGPQGSRIWIEGLPSREARRDA